VKIAMLVPPYRYGADPTQWITVPPQGYGGIQWVVATLADALLELGHDVYLLGAPGSPERRGLTVTDVTTTDEADRVLREIHPQVVHDHSNASLLPAGGAWPTISTSHLNGPPARLENVVYVSRAQQLSGGSRSGPVLPLPVNPARFRFSEAKDDSLLFLGRISAHKGARQAAVFARAVGLRLKMAGPAWERDYFDALLADFPDTIDYLGEVGGTERTELLARARALLVLSQTQGGPFEGWIEPGATVVSEAAVSGTPIIASDNGCLPEIVPGVGAILPELAPLPCNEARTLLDTLPRPAAVRQVATARWGHLGIAAKYVAIYERAINGGSWT